MTISLFGIKFCGGLRWNISKLSLKGNEVHALARAIAFMLHSRAMAIIVVVCMFGSLVNILSGLFLVH